MKTDVIPTAEEFERALDALVDTERLSRRDIVRLAVVDRYERGRGHHRRRSTSEPSRARPAQHWGGEVDRIDLM